MSAALRIVLAVLAAVAGVLFTLWACVVAGVWLALHATHSEAGLGLLAVVVVILGWSVVLVAGDLRDPERRR